MDLLFLSTQQARKGLFDPFAKPFPLTHEIKVSTGFFRLSTLFGLLEMLGILRSLGSIGLASGIIRVIRGIRAAGGIRIRRIR